MRDLLICNPAANPKHFRTNSVPTIVSHAAAITRKNERKFAKNGMYCPNVSKSHVTVVRNVSAKNSNAADKICMINPIRAFKIPITIADKKFTPLSVCFKKKPEKA